MGGIYDTQVYTIPIPAHLQNQTIASLEMLNILVALKLWAPLWSNKRILFECDNQAVVTVLQSGKTREHTLALYARNILMLASCFNIDIKVIHILGSDNKVADLLSRWSDSELNHQTLYSMVGPVQWLPTTPDLFLINTQI